MTARAGLEARDITLEQVGNRYAPEIESGLDVIRRFAERGGAFSANDARADLIAAGVGGSARGQVFRVARRSGIIRQLDDWETSTDPGTHGKPLPRYVSAGIPVASPPRGEVIAVPATRTRDGRFTGGDEPIAGQTDILAELGMLG